MENIIEQKTIKIKQANQSNNSINQNKTTNSIKSNKQPRAITMADNWKQKEIKNVLELRNEMLINNIDENLIKKYIDEQYNIINAQYQEKVQKYYNKQINNKNLHEIELKKELKNKRDKAIDFLIKNKTFLEDGGASQAYIKKYVEQQYNEINKTYTQTSILNENLDNINFID